MTDAELADEYRKLLWLDTGTLDCHREAMAKQKVESEIIKRFLKENPPGLAEVERAIEKANEDWLKHRSECPTCYKNYECQELDRLNAETHKRYAKRDELRRGRE